MFKNLNGSEPANEISGTVGGTVYPVLYVTIGAGERCATGSVTLRIADEYPGYWAGTEAYTDTSISLSSASGWQVYNGTSWVAAQSGPSGTDNKEGATPLRYRYVVTGGWLTHKTPFGNNGPHSVSTTSQIEFEEWVVGDGWTNEYPCGPAATSVTTENLWISSCTASNGTIDYFKYDPDGGPELAHPHLQFTISDADPHKYCCIIRFRETIGEGTWNWDSGWSSMRYEPQDATALTMDIDLTVPDSEGHCLNENDHKWGTYTYDFLVLEYTGASPVWIQDNAHDWNFLKRYREGYYLWVPKDLPSPHGDKPGHDVWTETPESGDTQFRGYYCLESEWASAEEAQVPRGDDVCVIVVDPELNERASKTGPSVPETLGANYGTVDSDQDDLMDGLLLYTFQDSDPAGTWRGIFTAADNGGLCSPEWRSHTPLRMITANQTVEPAGFYYIICSVDAGDIWHESVWWDWVRSGMKLTGVASKAWQGRLRFETGIAGGCSIFPADLPWYQRRVSFHVTTLGKTSEWTGEHVPAHTRHDKPGANGTVEKPDRSVVNIEAMEHSTHNPDPGSDTVCAWGNTNAVLHEFGWAGGTVTDPQQEDSSVMDATLDAQFYSATAKVHVWGGRQALYYGHVNDIRAHLGYGDHPNTPQP